MRGEGKNTKIELNHLDDFYELMFENMLQGVLLIDENGKLIKGNTPGLKILGLQQNEFSHFSNSPLEYYKVYDLENNELPYNKWPISRLMKKEKFRNEKYIIQTQGNEQKIHVSFGGIPQVDEAGNFSGGILFVNDISEEINAKYKLELEVGKKNQYYKQLELFQKQLSNDKHLLKSVIDSIPVMVVIYNSTIDTIEFNKAFEKITGWSKKDIQKTNIMELLHPNSADRKRALEFMKSLNPGFKDFEIRTKDRRTIETSWANVKISDDKRVGVGVDISVRKQLEKELTIAKIKAEKVSQIQSVFIQSISHEVRTPMNSILGFTELLYKYISEKKGIEFLDAINLNGRQLLRLIDDIIDFSMLDKKELSISKENISIKELMEQIKKQIPGLKKSYNKKHLKIYFKTSDQNHKDIMLFTDSLRLQQLQLNLICNAIKYTDEGKIEIGYKIRDDKSDVLFYVKDTGLGIKKSDHHKVFQRFIRLHEMNKPELRGTGLGLAICKHLAELLGGEIWFESEPGKGSEFYFTHPFLKYYPETFGKKKKEVSEKNYRMPDLMDHTILIVEDDVFSFSLMYHMLMDTNARILHADNGPKAIELMKSNKIDFVFLDIRLPKMNGFQVIQHIRKKNSQIPVIAQTANALPEDRINIKRAGFNYHITKPISQKDLFGVINKFIKVDQKNWP